MAEHKTHRVKFNQAVHLAGKDYTRGTHEVPEKVFGDIYFQKLAEAGLVEDGENQPVHHQSLQHRQKQLFDKIASAQGSNAGRRHLSEAGKIDVNNPPSQPAATEADPITGKARIADQGTGAGNMTGENPAQAAANPEGKGLADANPPDGGTGGSGSGMSDADVDDLEEELEEETNPSTGEKTHRKTKKRRHG